MQQTACWLDGLSCKDISFLGAISVFQVQDENGWETTREITTNVW